MTRLVNFGLGEVCDRVSILALKILYGELKQLDVAHFRNERTALLPKLVLRESGRWLEYWSDLAAVNAALWHGEDRLRALKAEGLTRNNADVVDCAFTIQEWNDRRAGLIQQINEFVGDKVQEKV